MGLVDRDEAALPPPPVQGMEGPQPYIAPLIDTVQFQNQSG